MSHEEILKKWPDTSEDFGTMERIYETMSEHMDHHKQSTGAYYHWLASAIAPYLGRRTMELGAGEGLVTRQMPRFDLYLVTETFEPYLDGLRAIARTRPDMQVAQLDVTHLDDEAAAYVPYQLDSVFSSNMLEHIKDDVAVLRSMAQLVRPGGRVVNFVPALRWLYGENDRSIGHFRRYERDELVAKMRAAGLLVENVFFFNLFGVLAWQVVNRSPLKGRVTQGNVGLFNRLVPVFRVLERAIPVNLGLSLVGVGRTPNLAS